MAEYISKIDRVKKIVYVDDSITPTKEDKQDIQDYLAAGYIKKHKSKKREEKATKKATEKKKKVKEALEKYPQFEEEYKKIKDTKGLKKDERKGRGSFAAASWLLDKVKELEEKDNKKK